LEAKREKRRAQRAVDRYLTSLLRERVTDVDERQRLRDARGLCNAHAWQLQSGGGALGISLIYRDILNTLTLALEPGVDVQGSLRARLLPGEGSPQRAAAALARRLAPTAPCPACGEYQVNERLAVGALLDYLRREEFVACYRQGDGLCLQHLLATLERAREAEPLREIVAVQLRVDAGLRAELDEFIRKNDYRFRDERMGAEGDAWVRAIGLAAGERKP
jgi:hypothetical protein